MKRTHIPDHFCLRSGNIPVLGSSRHFLSKPKKIFGNGPLMWSSLQVRTFSHTRVPWDVIVLICNDKVFFFNSLQSHNKDYLEAILYVRPYPPNERMITFVQSFNPTGKEIPYFKKCTYNFSKKIRIDTSKYFEILGTEIPSAVATDNKFTSF